MAASLTPRVRRSSLAAIDVPLDWCRDETQSGHFQGYEGAPMSSDDFAEQNRAHYDKRDAYTKPRSDSSAIARMRSAAGAKRPLRDARASADRRAGIGVRCRKQSWTPWYAPVVPGAPEQGGSG